MTRYYKGQHRDRKGEGAANANLSPRRPLGPRMEKHCDRTAVLRVLDDPPAAVGVAQHEGGERTLKIIFDSRKNHPSSNLFSLLFV